MRVRGGWELAHVTSAGTTGGWRWQSVSVPTFIAMLVPGQVLGQDNWGVGERACVLVWFLFHQTAVWPWKLKPWQPLSSWKIEWSGAAAAAAEWKCLRAPMATAVCGNTGPSQQTCLKWYSQILQSFYQGVPQSGASVNTSWSLLLLSKTGDIKVQFMKFSWSTPPKVRLVYSVRDQSKMRAEAMEEGWCLLIHQLFLFYLFIYIFFFTFQNVLHHVR